MKLSIWTTVLSVATVAVILSGCATETSRTLAVPEVSAAQIPFTGSPVQIAVGKFDNRSSYMRGIFSDGVDRLGS